MADEQLWIQQTKEGNVRAFSWIVEMYQQRAVYAAYNFVGNFEDARDLTQEAFVKAYENIGSFKQDSRFYTWFYRILSNTCADYMRKRKLRGALMFWRKPENGDGEEQNIQENIVSRHPDSSQALLSKELGEEIDKAMKCLPPGQRNVFVMRYLDGLSLEEIADQLQLSVGAVKAHCWQAGKKMRKFLESYKTSGGRNEKR